MKQIIATVLCSMLIVVSCVVDAVIINNKTQETSIQIGNKPSASAESTSTPLLTVTELPTGTPILTPLPTLTPTQEPTMKPIDLTKYTTMYVSGAVVNVRQSATTLSAKITSLSLNTTVKVYSEEDGWSYIGYKDNKFGYMKSEYLSKEPVTTPVPTPEPTIDPNFVFKYNTNLNLDDNVFLDALAYTGYNLTKHRADGNMWKFVRGADKKGLGYLSGLGYDYGKSTGYETNSQGLPDIQRFKNKGGLVCASYLTYVYFNYLPRVAGVDTSHLTKPDYPCSAQSWRNAARSWVRQGLSKKISFTAVRQSSGKVIFTAHEPIPIGSIVVFKLAGSSDSSIAKHVAIYQGNAGGYNWMTHVGNDRGPEMITIEQMGYGSTPEVPVEIITTPIYFE